MAAKLPDLDRRQSAAFLTAFTTRWEFRGGSQVAGVGRNGQPVFFHAGHPFTIRHDFLPRILRQLGVSREEFDAWYTRNG